MNQGRIWTVVNPGVGLPLFMGSVAVIAILVHAAVLNNTTWFPKYWNGATVAAPVAAPAAAVAPAKK